ncbi:MAG: preprotein translocase subunit YajC [Elusimicrobiota bacterium]|nr:preprotein translocase subunit YajC [Elusimicrobiota bacterium]
MNSLLYAQQQTQPSGSPLGGFLPLILIFFIFYFLLIRPQQKRAKEHKKLLAALKKGDIVITTGGIYGTITQVKPDTVELKIDESTKIQVLKSAIGQVVTQAETHELKT